MASATISTQGKALYAWSGSEWIPISAQNATINSLRWQKTLSSSASILSGEDDNGNELYYSPGYEQVYLNGILLVRDVDYNANDGLSIINLDPPLSASSNVEIIAPKALNLADVHRKDQVYTKIQSDERYLSASTSFEPDITYSSTAPSSPSVGTLWTDTTDIAAPVLKVYNGSEWITMSGAGGGGGGLKTTFLLMGV